ncbi:MAG: hypothetical protein ABL959_13045 [Pyrinomonadaceae bacterium]
MDEVWQKLLYHLSEGNFTALEQDLGGPEGFDRQIVERHADGKFATESEALAEALSCSCWLGRTATARYLIDAGVDPYAGMKTWLAGPHWAASSGQLGVIKMLIEKRIPLEIENKYGGTVLGQALWSAVNEHADSHADIIECLILAGAEVEPETLEWWQEQNVPDAETKRRVSEMLRGTFEFHRKVNAAKQDVKAAESGGSQRLLADSLKTLGNILRRPPFTRDAANEAYHRSAKLYRELGLPLEAAWVLRHIGINHEYAECLVDAEKYYDESLALFREHAADDDNNYANAVRYPAVIKNRIGKRDEATALWEEAVRRYDAMNEPLGVAEGAAWLAIFANEKGEPQLARKWLAMAEQAANRANDSDTDKWIAEVRAKLMSNERDER